MPKIIEINGGVPPYTISAITGLPNGVTASVSGSDINITGTAADSGTVTIDVAVEDARGDITTVQAIVNILPSINTLASPAITLANSSFNLTQNQSVNTQVFTVAGGVTPYSLAVTGLPVGLSLSSSGLLTGIPLSTGTVTVNVTITDANNQTDTESFDLVIIATDVPAGITVNQTPITITVNETIFIQAFTVEGSDTPLTVTATGLPSGVIINNTGAISGAASASGSFTVIATVTDSEGATDTATLMLNVATEVVGSSFLANGGFAQTAYIQEFENSIQNHGFLPNGSLLTGATLLGAGTPADPYRMQVAGEGSLQFPARSMNDFVAVIAARIDTFTGAGAFPLEQQLLEIFPTVGTPDTGKMRITLFDYGTGYAPRFFSHDGTNVFKVEPQNIQALNNLVFIGVRRFNNIITFWNLITGESFTRTTSIHQFGTHPLNIGRVQGNGTLSIFKAYVDASTRTDGEFYNLFVAPALAALNDDKGFGVSIPALNIANSVNYAEGATGQLTADGGFQFSGVNPYTWAKVSGDAAIAISSSGVVSGGVEATGTYSIDVRVTDAASQTRVETVTVTVSVAGVDPNTVIVYETVGTGAVLHAQVISGFEPNHPACIQSTDKFLITQAGATYDLEGGTAGSRPQGPTLPNNNVLYHKSPDVRSNKVYYGYSSSPYEVMMVDLDVDNSETELFDLASANTALGTSYTKLYLSSSEGRCLVANWGIAFIGVLANGTAEMRYYDFVNGFRAGKYVFTNYPAGDFDYYMCSLGAASDGLARIWVKVRAGSSGNEPLRILSVSRTAGIANVGTGIISGHGGSGWGKTAAGVIEPAFYRNDGLVCLPDGSSFSVNGHTTGGHGSGTANSIWAASDDHTTGATNTDAYLSRMEEGNASSTADFITDGVGDTTFFSFAKFKAGRNSFASYKRNGGDLLLLEIAGTPSNGIAKA